MTALILIVAGILALVTIIEMIKCGIGIKKAIGEL